MSFTLEALEQNAEAAPFEAAGRIHWGSAKQCTHHDKKEGQNCYDGHQHLARLVVDMGHIRIKAMKIVVAVCSDTFIFVSIVSKQLGGIR
jgi:hypothetical protein